MFFQHQADNFAKTANFRGIELMHISGMALQGLRVAIPTAIVALISSDELTRLLGMIPAEVTTGLRIAGGMITVVGFAMVINMMRSKALMPFFFLGFIAAAAIPATQSISIAGAEGAKDLIATLSGQAQFNLVAIGIVVSMIPAIKRFYTKKEDQAEALTRHLEFFNTQPWVASSIMGVTAAMEREKAAGKDIDEAAITNVKVGLMGPLAGVGDPIYWGTARIVLAALGASLAVTGNILGPLLFFFGLTAIRWATRWYGFKYGYEKGTQIVTEAGGNTLQKITQGASVMGLFVMGALVYRWTSVNIPLPLTSYKNQAGAMVDVTVQSVLNDLLPGLASLGLCFLCMWLLKKKVNAIWLIFALFAVGILGSYLGFLAL